MGGCGDGGGGRGAVSLYAPKSEYLVEPYGSSKRVGECGCTYQQTQRCVVNIIVNIGDYNPDALQHREEV